MKIINRTVNNALWIIGCKVVQAVLNLFITMFTARFLGPSNFGLINYAMSVVAFAAPIMKLGFTSIIVNELISHPYEEGKIIGTSLGSCCVSALLSIVGIFSFTMIANWGERDTIIVCMLYSLTLLAEAFEIIIYWFQAHLLSKYSSVVSLCAYFIVSGYKIYLLICSKSVYWFAIANALDLSLIALCLMLVYKKLGGQKLEFSLSICRKMLHTGKYYILSGMMVAVFAQTDRVMLKMMIDESATGFYSAAVSCAGVSSFVFRAIIDSARPAIFKSSKESHSAFEYNMINLYSVVINLSLLQSVIITLLAKPIIYILYGRLYLPSISALKIVVWYTTFSYMGAVKNVWLLAEQKQHLIWKIDLSGAAANIVLNSLLIPSFGINGAAFASLITQLFTNVIVLFIMRDTRRTVYLAAKSLNPKILINLVSK